MTNLTNTLQNILLSNAPLQNNNITAFYNVAIFTRMLSLITRWQSWPQD